MPTAATAPKIPLGVDLKNPLNVRDFHQDWAGETGAEKGFVKFSKAEYGVRAAGLILLGYQKRGKRTLRGIIATFAPPSENSTAEYISNVSKWTGWDADTEIDLFAGDCLFVLLKAMSRQEIGPNRFSDAVFREGARMALEKRRVKPKSERAKEIATATLGPAAAVEPLNQALTALTPLGDLPGVKWAVIGLSLTLAGIGIYLAIRGRK